MFLTQKCLTASVCCRSRTALLRLLRRRYYGDWVKDQERNNMTVFGSYADEYDSHRPFYPTKMWDDIMNDYIMIHHNNGDDPRTRKTAVDMAGGTGRGAMALSRRGYFDSVFCVDLDPDMLAWAAAQKKKRDDNALSNLETIQSAVEHTPLSSNSVDLIVCLQAFHWFDAVRAIREFHRLLTKPNGVAVVAWNDRDLEVAWLQELESIIERYNPQYDRTMKLAEHVVQNGTLFEQSGHFKVDCVKQYPNPVKDMTKDSMLDLLWTYSYVRNASMGNNKRTAKMFQEEVKELLIRHHGEDSHIMFDLDLICKCYILKPI